MRPSTSKISRTWLLSVAVAVVIAIALYTAVHADDTKRTGRYFDRHVLVHVAAQLDTLTQVVNLRFSSRITVGEALRTVLIGTGYHLLGPDAHPHHESRKLLQSRLAIAHQNFAEKRIDSVISAVIGAGRGFTLEVDHVARQIRIVPIFPVNSPPAGPPYRRYLQASHDQGEDR